MMETNLTLYQILILKAGILDGKFNLEVQISGNSFPLKEIEVKDGFSPDIICNSGSVSIVVIEANETSDDANYYIIGNTLYSQLL